MMKLTGIISFLALMASLVYGQEFKPVEDYIRMSAKAADPLYTTYAASMARSQLYGDKAFKMDYYSDCRPVTYTSDHAGSMFCIWKIDEVVIPKIGEYLKKPVVRFSFPDMAIMEYEPFADIKVKETFFVYSSSIALVNMEIRNSGTITHDVAVYPVLETGDDSLEMAGYSKESDGYITRRTESPYRLISSLKTEYGYPVKVRDFFTCNVQTSSHGAYSGNMDDFYNIIKNYS